MSRGKHVDYLAKLMLLLAPGRSACRAPAETLTSIVYIAAAMPQR